MVSGQLISHVYRNIIRYVLYYFRRSSVSYIFSILKWVLQKSKPKSFGVKLHPIIYHILPLVHNPSIPDFKSLTNSYFCSDNICITASANCINITHTNIAIIILCLPFSQSFNKLPVRQLLINHIVHLKMYFILKYE